MARAAVVIGIDDYPTSPLRGCVNDATRVAELLRFHADDGKENFNVRLHVAPDAYVDAALMSAELESLFHPELEVALFYFSGHGVLDGAGNAHLVSVDGRRGALGLSLATVLSHANQASPRIKSTIIILDCCHAGFAGEIPGLGGLAPSMIGPGVTILAATPRSDPAFEQAGRGLFTDLLVNGLLGECADLVGNVTPGALYGHLDHTLGPFEQRPIFKSNIQRSAVIRRTSPALPLADLRRLPGWFADEDTVYPLDPSCDDARDRNCPSLEECPVNPERMAVFRILQRCARLGLVEPVGEEHMFWAAMRSTGCQLTRKGKFYRRLAQNQQLNGLG